MISGGKKAALFLYDLPKWNILLGHYLFEQGMQFRHWIALEISACLPIPGRRHPSHYRLLYFSKLNYVYGLRKEAVQAAWY